MRQMIFMALLLTFLFGCCRNELGDDPPRQEETTLGISISETGATKSVGKDWRDEAIGTVAIYVFDDDGKADVCGEFKGGEEISLKCTRGVKTIMAVVNKPHDTAVQVEDISDMYKLTSNLEDNSEGCFVMMGSTVATVTGKEMDISMEVSRLACKVVFRSVTNGMKETAWKDKEMTLNALYLINVPTGPVGLFHGREPSSWTNKLTAEEGGPCEGLLFDKIGRKLEAGATYSEEHVFYAYPNHTASDANGGEWSPRKSRIVLEVSIGGRTCYYPITFGDGLDSNRQYIINNLTISKIGSSEPDFPVSSVTASFEVSMTDWNMTTIDKTSI